ncbi:hypothetical protein HDU87_005556 [Geranomyces variabilis]|uniref:Uncharacterized protein n=1 Tax=Geranomyces variabilis TaxID=109894 RepID=A0AAD5THV7_9FUNG|nr:hypothetical protein HDU87_005556 [Geranomyces variabilis]
MLHRNSISSTPREMGVLRPGPVPVRRSSAPGYGAHSSRHIPAPHSTDFLVHLQTLMHASPSPSRPAAVAAAMTTTGMTSPPFAAPLPSLTSPPLSKSAQFVHSWLSSLDEASEEDCNMRRSPVSATTPTGVGVESDAETSPSECGSSASSDPYYPPPQNNHGCRSRLERKRSLLDMLDNSIAELSADFKSFKTPVITQTATPPPSPPPPPPRRESRQHYRESVVYPPLQNLVDQLDYLSQRQAEKRRSTVG